MIGSFLWDAGQLFWTKLLGIMLNINIQVLYRYIQMVQSVDPDTGSSGSAFVVHKNRPHIEICKRTPSGVYTVEMSALLMAFQWGEDIKPDKVVACSDSSSVVKVSGTSIV